MGFLYIVYYYAGGFMNTLIIGAVLSFSALFVCIVVIIASGDL